MEEMKSKNVFKLWQSMDDHNETQLYGKLNETIDWTILRDIAESKKSITDYKPLHLKLKTSKILKKDLIQAPAGAYFISEKFKSTFDSEVFDGTILLPATINDVSYYAWIFQTVNDCLDRAKSQLEEFKYDENGEMTPVQFVFDESKIENNRFFKLPDDDYDLPYCDEIIGRKILANDLNLMAQPLIFQEKDLRKRVHYNNSVIGIEFEEPENWLLECKQLNKLKQGKKLTDKDWEIKFNASELDFGLFSFYRKQLLISTNWLQKAEIHVGLTKRTSEEYFTYRNAINPIEFVHNDALFISRINEYEWEKTLITPLKNELNLYIIVVNRTHLKTDEIYENEALEIVKSIRFNKLS
jgi:hypothetical protein